MNSLIAFLIGFVIGIVVVCFALRHAVRFVNEAPQSTTKRNLRDMLVGQLKVILPAEKIAPPVQQFKQCPHCGEPMWAQATWCKHCRKRTDKFQPQSQNSAAVINSAEKRSVPLSD
jgi:predicted RNA-binding Zn-ribbon protein involved in translation (DUF1610 family)